MSQESIDKFLKAHKSSWFSVREVAVACKEQYNTVDDNLRSMRKYNEVNYKRSIRIINGVKRDVIIHKYKA
jgi:hypothetical protein